MTRGSGREVRYNAVSPEVYRSFGFPGAEDLGNMFQFKRDFEIFCGARNVAVGRVPSWTRRCKRSMSGSHEIRATSRWSSRGAKPINGLEPLNGVEGQGWFLGIHCFTKYVKVAFFRGTSLFFLSPRRVENQGDALPRHPRGRPARRGSNRRLGEASQPIARRTNVSGIVTQSSP